MKVCKFDVAMEEENKHLISAAAFVASGTQDACDDACSICLEPFSNTDPPTVGDYCISSTNKSINILFSFLLSCSN